METTSSQPQPQEVGGTSDAPPSITSSATKRKSAPVLNQKRHPAAKRVKSPMAVNCPLKRPAETSKQKQPAAKRFKPPMAGKKPRSPAVTSSPAVTGSPAVTRSPMMRLVVAVSPVAIGPRLPTHSPQSSPAVERPSSPTFPPSPTLEEQTRETDDPGSTSTQIKPRKLRSDIWKDMDPIYHDGKLIQARCKHCYEVFSATRSSGNSHMRRHVGVCEPRLRMLDMAEKLQSSVVSTETTVLTNWKFDHTITRCELVRLIVLHELPFSFVEYEGFRSYSLSLNPLAESVSRTTIKENCMEAFKNHRFSIKDLFGGCNNRFSLTADLWTSNQNTGYMVVTCHYIDADWKVQKRIIRFCVVKTPHDGFDLYSVLLKTICYYNIEDKIYSITLDNASANNSMMDLLQVNLLGKSMLHCDGDLFHIRCAAHVLNLIVKDGLLVIESVIHDIRESVKYIQGSQSRKEKFEEIIAEKGIDCGSRPSLDVPTRWNSTCDMLELALLFKEAFRELARKDHSYVHSPSLEEWRKAKVVCKLLLVFKSATAVVSGSRYPTANLYFHEIWNVREVLESEASSTNTFIASMVSEMRTKFDKYWNISYLSNCIPVILDPRFKFGFVEFRLKQAFGDTATVHIAKVDGAIRSLFSGYSSEMGDEIATSTQSNANTTSGRVRSWSDWSSHISARSSQVTGELDRYLRDDLFPCDDENFDILYWWKMHAAKYPTVARMARDVMAAPASTVASESAFSTGGRIISDHRTRLSGNTVEALICFQDWLRTAGPSYLDIIKIDSAGSSVDELGPAA